MTDRARFCNMHCHRSSGGGPELVSVVSPGAYPLESLEFHPWYLPNEYNGIPNGFAVKLQQCCALGEVGLDRLRGPGLPVQLRYLEELLDLAQREQKPVVFHCVRCFPELMRLTDSFSVPKLLHGFRGNCRLLEELRSKNWFVSFRRLENPDVIAALKQDGLSKIGFETDAEENLTIEAVVAQAQRVLDMDVCEAACCRLGDFLQ